eukprot:gene16720-19874_t
MTMAREEDADAQQLKAFRGYLAMSLASLVEDTSENTSSSSSSSSLLTSNNTNIVVLVLPLQNDCADVLKFKVGNTLLDIGTETQSVLDIINGPKGNNKSFVQKLELVVVKVQGEINNNQPPQQLFEYKQVSNILKMAGMSTTIAALPDMLAALARAQFDLSSISVTGIPMKESSQATRVVYDVVLLYKDTARSRLIRTDDARMRAYATLAQTTAPITLRWRTNDRKLPVETLSFTCSHRVTPHNVISHPSICLMKHISAGKPVFLAHGADTPFSHVLALHETTAVLHCLHTPLDIESLVPILTCYAPDSPVMTKLRMVDFSEMSDASIVQARRSTTLNSLQTIRVPNPFAEGSNTTEATVEVVTPRLVEKYTRYFPWIESETIFFAHEQSDDLRRLLDPIKRLMLRDTAPDDFVEQISQLIYQLYRSNQANDPSLFPKAGVAMRKENYKRLWGEFQLFARACGSDNALWQAFDKGKRAAKEDDLRAERDRQMRVTNPNAELPTPMEESIRKRPGSPPPKPNNFFSSYQEQKARKTQIYELDGHDIGLDDDSFHSSTFEIYVPEQYDARLWNSYDFISSNVNQFFECSSRDYLLQDFGKSGNKDFQNVNRSKNHKTFLATENKLDRLLQNNPSTQSKNKPYRTFFKTFMLVQPLKMYIHPTVVTLSNKNLVTVVIENNNQRSIAFSIKDINVYLFHVLNMESLTTVDPILGHTNVPIHRQTGNLVQSNDHFVLTNLTQHSLPINLLPQNQYSFVLSIEPSSLQRILPPLEGFYSKIRLSWSASPSCGQILSLFDLKVPPPITSELMVALDSPSPVTLYQKFSVTFKISNLSSKTKQITLNIPSCTLQRPKIPPPPPSLPPMVLKNSTSPAINNNNNNNKKQSVQSPLSNVESPISKSQSSNSLLKSNNIKLQSTGSINKYVPLESHIQFSEMTAKALSAYDDVQRNSMNLICLEKSIYVGAANGVPALVLTKCLLDSAKHHSEYQASTLTMTHEDPLGSKGRFTNYGNNPGWSGENVAFGQFNDDQVMESWMDSPGHRSNILNPNFTAFGVRTPSPTKTPTAPPTKAPTKTPVFYPLSSSGGVDDNTVSGGFHTKPASAVVILFAVAICVTLVLLI